MSLSYSLCLRGAGGEVLARRSFAAQSDEEASIVAAALLDATCDVAGRCELWCADREVALARRTPKAAQVNAHFQQLVIDQEIALRDSRQRIAQSRRLLKQIGAWSSGVKGG